MIATHFKKKKNTKVDYNIYLEPNVADKTVQSIIEQVAPSSAGGNTKPWMSEYEISRNSAFKSVITGVKTRYYYN
jgi:hypothetical protein